MPCTRKSKDIVEKKIGFIMKRIYYNIDIIKDILTQNSDTKLLSIEYVNLKTPLIFKCGKCGKIFQKRWDNMLYRCNFNCQACCKSDGNINKKSKTNVQDTIESFGFQLIGEYHNTKSKLLVRDKNGYKGYISYENICKGKHFSIFSSIFNLDNLIDNINNFAIQNDIKSRAVDFIEMDKNRSNWIMVRCECGDMYKTNVASFIKDSVTVCPKCSKRMSKYEVEMENILKSLNIKYEKQYTFKNCINDLTRYKLRFDFYLPVYNTVIECDGQQHYRPINFGGESQEKAITNFKYTQYKDNIKDEYCKNNNINIVRISYRDFDNNNVLNIIQFNIM